MSLDAEDVTNRRVNGDEALRTSAGPVKLARQTAQGAALGIHRLFEDHAISILLVSVEDPADRRFEFAALAAVEFSVQV